MITVKRTPYEFLVRWDKDGKLSGAHVGFLDSVYDGLIISTQTACEVQPVAVGTTAGFPLADILALVNSGITDQGAAFIAACAKADADKIICDLACKAAEEAKVKSDLATEVAKIALAAQLAAEKALSDAQLAAAEVLANATA